MMRNRRLLFIISILVACVLLFYAYGYLKTSIKIAWYSEKHGIHATFDEAVDDYIIRRKELFLNPQDVLIRKERDQYYPFIWYVEFKNRVTLTDNDPTNDIWLPGKYFILTRNGWLEYPMSELASTTDLGFWMELYHLYGFGPEQVQ